MKNIVRNSYLASMFTSIIGAIIKITHSMNYSEVFLVIGIISFLVFVVTAIMEVNRSKKISDSEKFMWGVGFISFGAIVGLVYILSARKRIV